MDLSVTPSQPALRTRAAVDAADSDDEEIKILDIPNQQEINSVAGLLVRETNRADPWHASSRRCQFILNRLEALHDNPENEKSVLFNKLHTPLENFLQLAHVRKNEAFDLRERGNKLLSLWRMSLGRSTPTPQRFIPSAVTPSKILFIPRDISESPEPRDNEYTLMDLDTDTKGSNSTTDINQPLLSTLFDQASEPAVKNENVKECELCGGEVSMEPHIIKQYIKSMHKGIMGKKTEVPKNPIEFCEEHDTWFVHTGRERHYKKPHRHISLPEMAYVFDAKTLSKVSGKRPVGMKSGGHGKDLNTVKHALPDVENIGEISDEEDAAHRQISRSYASSSSTSSCIDGTSSPTTDEDDDDDVPPIGHYNLRGNAQRKPSASPLERTAPVKSTRSARLIEPSTSEIMVNRRSRLNSDTSKRWQLRNGANTFKAALKECTTNADVQRLVAERVGSPSDDTEVIDAQSRSSVSFRHSQVVNMVRERAGDEDFVADICDIPGHHNRILYLEAKCELLTRRNVALEGERAKFKALAQRAMYGGADDTPSRQEEALDQLVREHLDWEGDSSGS